MNTISKDLDIYEIFRRSGDRLVHLEMAPCRGLDTEILIIDGDCMTGEMYEGVVDLNFDDDADEDGETESERVTLGRQLLDCWDQFASITEFDSLVVRSKKQQIKP